MRKATRFVSGLLLFTVLGWTGCQKKEEKKPQAPEVSETAAGDEKKKVQLLPGAWEADVRANLLKMIASHGKNSPDYDSSNPPVVVFDFDNTCIRGDIGRAFFDYMVSNLKIKFDDDVFEALPADKRDDIRKLVKELQKLPDAERSGSENLQELRKKMHQAYWSLCKDMDAAKCYPWQVRFYAGYTPGELTRMANQVMQDEMKKPMGSEQIKSGPDDKTPAITSTGIRVHNEIRELMYLLRKKGFRVWVVTAGPQWVVEGAAKQFAMAHGQVIGMRAKLDKGKLTAEIEPPPTYRQGKVDAIEKLIGTKPVLTVGDSWTDAEMLAYGENALLIDRGYSDLRKKASESGWWIQPAFEVK